MSDDDWTNDPEMRRWARQVSDRLVPMLRESSATVSLVPDVAGLGDVKMAVELGMSIMLGKPIVLVVLPGRQIPAKLVAIADAIVEVGDDMNRGDYERIMAAVERVSDVDDQAGTT